MPQHVVGTVEDVLELQAHLIGGDPDVVGLLLVHLRGPAAGDHMSAPGYRAEMTICFTVWGDITDLRSRPTTA